MKLLIFHFVLCYVYRPQRSWGKIIFSQASVILLIGGGGLSQHALQVISQHALQQVSRRGGSAPGGISAPGGCLLWGVAFCYGLLSWSSVMPFCYGLLVWWPSD